MIPRSMRPVTASVVMEFRHREADFSDDPPEERFYDIVPCSCCEAVSLVLVDPCGAVVSVEITDVAKALTAELNARIAAREQRP
ncbi:hypothetical protein [Oricola sp.]|uniref:hypothetical protein n=1 Tax=Oricola sp. TaxID=1979950 RepID=UPI0025F64A2E|nr:hypothetical protein [Oricola sp.]MCI5075671.1 hypothetical protein [Oricola sp.]